MRRGRRKKGRSKMRSWSKMKRRSRVASGNRSRSSKSSRKREHTSCHRSSESSRNYAVNLSRLLIPSITCRPNRIKSRRWCSKCRTSQPSHSRWQLLLMRCAKKLQVRNCWPVCPSGSKSSPQPQPRQIPLLKLCHLLESPELTTLPKLLMLQHQSIRQPRRRQQCTQFLQWCHRTLLRCTQLARRTSLLLALLPRSLPIAQVQMLILPRNCMGWCCPVWLRNVAHSLSRPHQLALCRQIFQVVHRRQLSCQYPWPAYRFFLGTKLRGQQ